MIFIHDYCLYNLALQRSYFSSFNLLKKLFASCLVLLLFYYSFSPTSDSYVRSTFFSLLFLNSTQTLPCVTKHTRHLNLLPSYYLVMYVFMLLVVRQLLYVAVATRPLSFCYDTFDILLNTMADALIPICARQKPRKYFLRNIFKIQTFRH